jgi:hypothetical protein
MGWNPWLKYGKQIFPKKKKEKKRVNEEKGKDLGLGVIERQIYRFNS